VDIKKGVFIFMVSFFMIVTTSFSSALVSKDQTGKIASLGSNGSGPYEGRLRVYIVKPLSFWKDHAGANYQYFFVDFPLIKGRSQNKWDEDLSINYLDTYSKTVTWNGFFFKNNVMVIAAVYDARGYLKYSYENEGAFLAHYLDAAAAARPGETAYNTVNEDFTHTVIVETVSSTKCPYCPIMEDALYKVYNSGKYPFYLINMVDNRNQVGSNFLFHPWEGYNQKVVPEAYFDGGYGIMVGGDNDTSHYIENITACGKRDVHDLNLSLSVAYTGLFTLEFTVTIKNNEESHHPLKPTAPYNNSTQYLKGKEYIFSTSTVDPDGDDLYYMFNYSNFYGTATYQSGWLGPYHSGDTVNATLSWNKKDVFKIRVVAKDSNGEVGPWSNTTAVSIQ